MRWKIQSELGARFRQRRAVAKVVLKRHGRVLRIM